MFKLIRDKIPEIMKSQDKVCNYAKAVNDELYDALLVDKLIEEVNEFLESRNVSELIDIQEVINAIVATKANKEDFEKAREEIKEQKGGFEERLIGFFPDTKNEVQKGE